MQEISKNYLKIMARIQVHDWEEQKKISFNEADAALILELIERREKELESHRARYAANSEEMKRKSSERYYTNKTKICEQKKQKRVMGAFKAYG